MKPSIYYGVQFAQSRLLLLSQSGRHSEIDRLVCRGAEISLPTVIGEGGWRNDLAATQFIEADPAGEVVRGYWTTLGAIVAGGAPGGAEKTLSYVVGAYANEFAREDGIWKFRRLSWQPLVATVPWVREPDPALDRHLADRRSWIEVPEGLRAVSDDGVSPRTLITLELRNTFMGFCHRYNTGGAAAWDSTAVSRSAADAARAALAPESGASSGFLLATSPVVSCADDGLSATVFASVTHLRRRGEHEIEHQRGSVRMGFARATATSPWTIDEFRWYRYATLDPWTLA